MQKTVLDRIKYEISIEDFETAMNTESSKDKKEKILELFRNHNELKSTKEFNNIKFQLHYACREGDLELIKILLSETIEDDSKKFLIKINKTNKTSLFFGTNQDLQDLIIPRTVKHENNDYLITSICGLHYTVHYYQFKIKFEEESAVSTIYGYSFFFSNIEEISIPPSLTKICERAFSGCENLRKVEIPSNSNLQTIEKHAFSYSNIEEIYFPKSLIELKEGWCHCIEKLTRIMISPSNGQFIFKENKYLIEKSNQNDAEFDKLVFVRRDIKEFLIPQNIKIIGSCSFEYSNIEEIFIPSSVTKICERAFSGCENLRKVEIPSNSNLQTIEKHAFLYSNIEEIYFPKSLIELKEGWCSGTEKLRQCIISPSNGQFIFKEDKYLIGKSNQNNAEFDKLLFVRRDIKDFSIPQNIKIIGSYSFEYSNIEEIFIPSSVTKVCKGAFSGCFNLIKVEIPTNSNLQTIENIAFSESKIEAIFIPSSVTKICKDTFSYCDNLIKVEIPKNSNLQIIENDAFFKSKIEEIFIPPSVTKICEDAFSDCFNLRKVEIPTNSNLQEIGRSAFSSSKIKEIFIPHNVTKICEDAFSYCSELQIIEISEESQLQSISKSSFNCCFAHMIIMIPSSLKELIKIIDN